MILIPIPTAYARSLVAGLTNFNVHQLNQIMYGWRMFHHFSASVVRNGVTLSFHLVQAGAALWRVVGFVQCTLKVPVMKGIIPVEVPLMSQEGMQPNPPVSHTSSDYHIHQRNATEIVLDDLHERDLVKKSYSEAFMRPNPEEVALKMWSNQYYNIPSGEAFVRGNPEELSHWLAFLVPAKVWVPTVVSCSCLGVHYYSKLLASCYLLPLGPFWISPLLGLWSLLFLPLEKGKKKSHNITAWYLFCSQIII